MRLAVISRLCYLPLMNVRVTRAAEGLERRALTIADLERMAEAGVLDPDERLELIGGEMVPMAAKGSCHETLKVSLTYLWGRECPAGFMFAQETGLRLDPLNYLEPDFIVFARTKRLADVRGPDVLLAVEVADSSLDYDLYRKPMVYAAFGVAELWVIDAARRVVHRHEGVAPEGYTSVRVCDGGDRLVPSLAPEAFAFALDALEAL